LGGADVKEATQNEITSRERSQSGFLVGSLMGQLDMYGIVHLAMGVQAVGSFCDERTWPWAMGLLCCIY